MLMNITNVPVIYINLERDVEKRKSMESFFFRYGFTSVYRSPGVIVENQPACVGIAHAFRNAFDLAFSLNADAFLIFEDDIVARDSFSTMVNIPEDYDAVYLGVSTWGIQDGIAGEFAVASKTSMEGILRISNMLSGHGILYRNGEYARIVRSKMDDAIRNRTYQDIEFANTMLFYKVYAFSDPLIYQTSTLPREVTDLNFGDFLHSTGRLA